ncbi:MAG: hypothetical protein CMJ80_18110 [Planctomycetaceae bacterium]|nr:hypothetical protein [Planctomycetaceae bacterium]
MIQIRRGRSPSAVRKSVAKIARWTFTTDHRLWRTPNGIASCRAIYNIELGILEFNELRLTSVDLAPTGGSKEASELEHQSDRRP